MLQIRLSKGSSADGGRGAAEKPPPTLDTVTVACPDHLEIADLPVAKSVGAVTSSTATVRTVGRRSRRSPGDRVHFCIRCDFPVAIYGRLVPCEHVFCLACARSDASCYLCDERIQKIQSIKLLEGIFICAALHCLKSFLKQTDLVAHIHEVHPDLIQSNTKKEAIHSHSSTDTHKQSITQEASTACAPPQRGFSVSTNSQQQNRDERTHSQQFNDYPSTVELQHLRLMQADNLPQGSDKSNAWMNLSQDFMSQAGLQIQQVSNQSFVPNHGVNPLQPPLQPNYQLPVNHNQAILPPAAVSYPLSADGSQQFYGMPYQLSNPEQLQAGGPVQGSALGFSPAHGGIATFAGNGPRPWFTGQMVVPMDPSVILAQGTLQGYTNLTDAQRNNQLSGGWLLNQPQIGQDSNLQGVSAVNSDSNGVFAQQLQQPGSLQIQLHR